MQITNMKLSDIHPYEKNPRFNDEAVDVVASSIKEFGFKSPIIVDKDHVIICGHTRFSAAKRLGLTEVPCIVAADLTPEQVQAFRIADNKTGEIAEWNYDLLPIEVRELQEANFDLSLLGFDTEELDKLLNGGSDAITDGETDADAVPEVPEEAVSRRGEVYRLGDHLLMCGDSTKPEDVARLMNGQKADLVFTDPPYGVSYKGVNNPGGREWKVIKNDDLGEMNCMNSCWRLSDNIISFPPEKRAFTSGMPSAITSSLSWPSTAAGFGCDTGSVWNKGMVLGHSDYHWLRNHVFTAGMKEETANVRRPLPDHRPGTSSGTTPLNTCTATRSRRRLRARRSATPAGGEKSFSTPSAAAVRR